jgi:hypothetical protein
VSPHYLPKQGKVFVAYGRIYVSVVGRLPLNQVSGRPPAPWADAGVNQMALADRAVHDWYRFRVVFPPHLVRDLPGTS